MKDSVLSATKAELIDLMKCEGEISVEEGAEELGLAPTTIRQHLGKLVDLGFVETRNERYGRGRPLKMYSLTEKSDVWYENTDSEVLASLLSFLKSEGQQPLLERFFQAMADDYLRKFEAFSRGRSEDRLGLVCRFMEARGFLPECQRHDADEATICFCHCPYRAAAKTTEFPCAMEERFLEAALGKRLIRQKHIASGDSVCEYRVVNEIDAD
jgi:predicted ArsR family transcriptional regulator